MNRESEDQILSKKYNSGHVEMEVYLGYLSRDIQYIGWGKSWLTVVSLQTEFIHVLLFTN